LFHALAQPGIKTVARLVRAGTAVMKARLAEFAEAVTPFARRAHADPPGLGSQRQAHHADAFDQQKPALVRQSGILMAVHPATFL
jgi:hypothetical protein